MPPGLSVPNLQTSLNQDISNIGQFATTFQTPTYNSPNVLPKGGVGTSPSGLDAFFSTVGNVFGEGAHLVEGAAGWVGRQAVQSVVGAAELVPSLVNLGEDTFNTYHLSSQANDLNNQINTINSQFQSGQISKDQYLSQLSDWNKANSQVSTQLSGLITKGKSDSNAFLNDTIATESDLLMFAGGPLLKAATTTGKLGVASAAEWLTSKMADSALTPVEDAISKLADNKATYSALAETAQNAIKSSVTDTLINSAKTATAGQIARNTAINLAIKYPITFNWIDGTGDQLAKEFQSGKYGSAISTIGLNMGFLLAGGPIGAAFKYGGSALKGLSGAVFGQTSFLDTLSKALFNDPNAIYGAIKDNPDAIKAFQALEATNKAAVDGRVVDAAYQVVNGLKAFAVPDFTTTGLSAKDYVDQYVMNWHAAQSHLTNTLISKGMTAAEASRYVVGRWTAADAHVWARAITEGEVPKGSYISGGTTLTPPQNTNDMLKNFETLKQANPDHSAANSATLNDQIKQIITNSKGDATQAHEEIANITASGGIAPDQLKQLSTTDRTYIAKLGYTPIVPSHLEAPFIQGDQKLITSAASESGDFFQKAVQPLPVLGNLGGMLTAAGLSPERSALSSQEVYRANVAQGLTESSLIGETGARAERSAQNIIGKVSDYVNNINSQRVLVSHPPINDWRQLTIKELSAATGRTEAESKVLADVLNDAMLKVNIAQRGLGNKLIDHIQALNTGGKFSMNGYLRVQGAGRFAWNPFFKMKLAAKSEILSQLETGGQWPSLPGLRRIASLIAPKTAGTWDATSKMLETGGFFGGGYSGEAAGETTGLLGNPTSAGLVKSQKIAIAGVVDSMARGRQLTTEEFITNFPNQTRDVVQSILHYDPRSSFLNSPLARTLNFAVFPFRFNVKVSTFMARAIQRQSAMVQMGIVHGLMQAHTFLSSQEGQVWYSQNADVLGLLTYFTPLETIATISALGNIGHESIGAYGELGGLPASFILQMLNAEGYATNLQQAYLNPKTGQPSPNYIPNTDLGKLATAISSFLGSLFTYPGAEAGLPSKTKILSNVSEFATGTTSADWTPVAPNNLTQQQQQYEQALAQLRTTNGQQTQVPGAQQGSNTTVPATGSGTAQPFYTKTDSSTPPTPKLKKSQEPVQLLPGQTQIGQVQ